MDSQELCYNKYCNCSNQTVHQLLNDSDYDNSSLFTSCVSECFKECHVTIPILIPLLAAVIAILMGTLSMNFCRNIYFHKYQTFPQSFSLVVLVLSILVGVSVPFLTLNHNLNSFINSYAGESESFCHIVTPLLIVYSASVIPSNLITLRAFATSSVYAFISGLVSAPLLGAAFLVIVQQSLIPSPIEWSLNVIINHAYFVGLPLVISEAVASLYRLKTISTSRDIIFFLETEFLLSVATSTLTTRMYVDIVITKLHFSTMFVNLAIFPFAMAIAEFCLYFMRSTHRDEVRDTLLYVTATYVSYVIPTLLHFSGTCTTIAFALYLTLNGHHVHHQTMKHIIMTNNLLHHIGANMVYAMSGLKLGNYFYNSPAILYQTGHAVAVALCACLARIIAVSIAWPLCRCTALIHTPWRMEIVKLIGSFNGSYTLLFGLRFLHILTEINQANEENGHNLLFYLVIVVLFRMGIQATIFPIITFYANIELWERKQKHFNVLVSRLDQHLVQDFPTVADDRFFLEARWDQVVHCLRLNATSPYHVVKLDDLKVHPIQHWLYEQIGRIRLDIMSNTAELEDDRKTRTEVLRIMQASFVKQARDGQISTWAKTTLTIAAEDAINEGDATIYIESQDDHFRIPVIWRAFHRTMTKLNKKVSDRTDHQHPPKPTCWLRKFCFELEHSWQYQAFTYLILFTHMVTTAVEMPDIFKQRHPPTFIVYFNKACYSFYIVEFMILVIALGKNIFYTKWNYLDLVFAIISLADLILVIGVFNLLKKYYDHANEIIAISELICIVIRLTKLLRFIRVAIPGLYNFSVEKIHRSMTSSYEILRALASSEEDALRLIAFMDKPIHTSKSHVKQKTLQTLKQIHAKNKIEAIRELGRRSTENCDILSAVQTKRAIICLNCGVQRKLYEWYDVGEIDDNEYAIIEEHLLSVEDLAVDMIPYSIKAPDLNLILNSLPWVQASGTPVKEFILKNAVTEKVEAGTYICRQGQQDKNGLVIVSNGIIKITVRSGKGVIVMEEYSGRGSFFGEISLLTDSVRTADIITDTEAELCKITEDKGRAMVQEFPFTKEKLIRSFCIRKVYTDVFARQKKYQSWSSYRVKSLMNQGSIIILVRSTSKANKRLKSQMTEYFKSPEDEFIVLARGCCTVDQTDMPEGGTPVSARPANVTISEKGKCIVLPNSCQLIKYPPPRKAPKDGNVWLYVMKKAETAATVATTPLEEGIIFESYAERHPSNMNTNIHTSVKDTASTLYGLSKEENSALSTNETQNTSEPEFDSKFQTKTILSTEQTLLSIPETPTSNETKTLSSQSENIKQVADLSAKNQTTVLC